MGGPTSRPLAHSILGGGGGLGSGGGGAGVSGLTSGVIGAQGSGGLVGPTGAPFGVVGVEPEFSKYKGEFTSMTALAAACASLGDIAYLVGLATRQPICLCRRVDVGASGIAWQGMVELLQSSGGAEFDGIYAWTPVAAAAAPAWGAPGSESTGGVQPAVGALRLPGFAPFSGLRRSVYGEWYLELFPGVPVTADSLLTGLLPSGSTAGDYYAGGLAYNTGTYRSAVSANGNPSAPGLGYGAAGGVPVAANKFQTHFDGQKISTTADASSYTGGASQGDTSPAAPPASAALGLDASGNTFNFCISRIGTWTARLIRFCVLPIYG